MLRNPLGRLRWIRLRHQILLALARGAAESGTRLLDPADPVSWEFRAFSQNGEDGILDYLTRRLPQPNRRFIEIGSAKGLKNNTAWLAIARRYRGLMVEGDPKRAAKAQQILSHAARGVEAISLFLSRERIAELRARVPCLQPDVFSLDIDGVDWHIAAGLFAAGFRPRVFVVEFNSAFGPECAVTVPYRADFDLAHAHQSKLYYGASIMAWRRLFERHGYRFVTVESSGVNAFFLDPPAFAPEFLVQLGAGLAFAENETQWRRFREPWERQFTRIRSLPLVEVSDPEHPVTAGS